MRRWGQIGPAEVMPALSHGWWKGWRGPKPLAADFRDRGRGFNALSVIRWRIEWLDASNGYTVGASTWRVVRGTGAYADISGSGRRAASWLPRGPVSFRAEGYLHSR